MTVQHLLPAFRWYTASDPMTDTAVYIPEWPPNWINAPGDDLRSYSSPDSVLIQTDDVVRCAVSTSATTFVSIFSPVFMVFFWVVCWFGIVDLRAKRSAWMVSLLRPAESNAGRAPPITSNEQLGALIHSEFTPANAACGWPVFTTSLGQ